MTHRSKGRLGGLAALGLAGLACACSEPSGFSVIGTWGGLGKLLSVQSDSVVVHGCGERILVFPQPLVPDADGRFVLRQPGPEPDSETILSGRMEGRDMELRQTFCLGGLCTTEHAPLEGEGTKDTFLLSRDEPARWLRSNGIAVCVPPPCLGCPP